MQLSHTRPVMSATFDEPNLMSAAGLVPLMALAGKAGLRKLADERMSVPTDKGANAGLKLSSLVAGMAAGADSIDDMALLRHGGMGKVFTGAYAPSTLGSFLRSFTFGHVGQADAVASRFLLNLAEHTALFGDGEAPRLVHHHRPRRPRHRRRGPDPPAARDHRERPRRPQGLGPGAPALGRVHRQRGLAGLRRDDLQPHPRRRHRDEGGGTGEGDHRDDP